MKKEDDLGKARNTILRLAGGVLLVAFLFQTAWAAPKMSPKAKPGDCRACHGKESVLPDGHGDTRSMDWKACQACHREGKLDLTGKLPGGHRHLLSGVTCTRCHGKTAKPKPLKADACIACHGSPEKLAASTAQVKPENPHTSPHYGTSLDCNLCHHQHAKSEDYCGQCHKFDFRTP